MMNSKSFTDHEIIEKTRRFIHYFYDRKMNDVIKDTSEDFVWIGTYDFQWTKGQEAFQKITYTESQEAPVHLSQEEYHVLSHDKTIWIVYSRYTANAPLEDGTLLHAKVRGTYIWKQFGNELKMIHVHGSNAQDVPLVLPAGNWESYDGETGFFNYIRNIDVYACSVNKIQFRDRTNCYHFLSPSEVVYLKADRQWCTVFSKYAAFEVRGGISHYEELLPENFIRIHKSYLVNKAYIATVRRYMATLRDGAELPIGKERYMRIKEILKESHVKEIRVKEDL